MSENQIQLPQSQPIEAVSLMHPSMFENELYEDDVAEHKRRAMKSLLELLDTREGVVLQGVGGRMLTPEQAREEGVTDTGYGAYVIRASVWTKTDHERVTAWRKAQWDKKNPAPSSLPRMSWWRKARLRIKKLVRGHRQSPMNRMIREQ